MKRSGPGRPKLDQPSEAATRRRADLLEAGFDEIARSGLEGLRTRDVAARAGVNIATLHYYFGSKEELIEALVEHVGTKFAGGERRSFAADSTETLEEHLTRSWGVFEKTPGLAVVLQELVVRAQRDASARKAFRALFAGWRGHLANVLRVGREAGRYRADLDERDGAVLVSSFVMGAMMQLGIEERGFDFLAVARKVERLLGASSSDSSSKRTGAGLGARPTKKRAAGRSR